MHHRFGFLISRTVISRTVIVWTFRATCRSAPTQTETPAQKKRRPMDAAFDIA